MDWDQIRRKRRLFSIVSSLGRGGGASWGSGLTLVNASRAGNTITKTGGGNFEGNAYDPVPRSGDILIEFTIPVGSDVFVGINADPPAGSTYSNIDFAFYSEAGNLYKSAPGALNALGVTQNGSDVLAVRKVGADVSLEKNGVALWTWEDLASGDYSLDSVIFGNGQSWTLLSYGAP